MLLGESLEILVDVISRQVSKKKLWKSFPKILKKFSMEYKKKDPGENYAEIWEKILKWTLEGFHKGFLESYYGWFYKGVFKELTRGF